jgi:phosphate transport system permease protein
MIRAISASIRFFSYTATGCIALLFFVILGGLIFSAIHADISPLNALISLIPMVTTTLLTALLAVLFAIPLSFGILYSIWVHNIHILRWLLRFMSGIPTVVYGFCGLMILVPVFRAIGGGTGFSVLLVSVILCFLILPTLTIVADSAMHNIMNQSGLLFTTAALGMSKPQAFLHVAIYAQRYGLVSAALLAFGRAMGDTLIALMLSGNTAIMPEGLFSSVRTLAGHISLLTATALTADIEFTLFMAGSLLFAASLGISIAIQLIKRA